MKKEIIIKAQKQENGLWGTPLSCTKIDSMCRLSESDEIKRSAIIMAIAERYPDETFYIFFSDKKGFFIKLKNSEMRKVIYSNYELNDNVLIYSPIQELGVDL